MELISSSIIFSLMALFFSLPLMFFFTRNKSQLPPGKTGWPLIGESLSFFNSGLSGVPAKFVQDRMQMFSPKIFKTSLLGQTVAVLCGPAGNKFLFSNENKLVKAWYPTSVDKIFPSSVKESGSEEAARFRKMLPAFVNAEALQRYAATIDSITKQHLKTHWENNKEVIAAPLIKKYTFSVACKLFLGIDDPVHLERLSGPFSIMAIGIMSLPINLPGTALNKAINASEAVRKDLLGYIKKRKVDLMENKSSVPQDILSHMLLTMHEHGEDERAVAVKSFALILGSLDTISTTITFVL
ncbi:Beta-amyrin 28-monooxygenase, partial [Thalictrum thalictroides]